MMKFLAILVALGIEQWRISSWRRASESFYVSFLRKLELLMTPDRNKWLITAAAISPVVLVLIIDWLTGKTWWLTLGWSVLLLYFLMGFRHISHAVADINENLQEGDLPAARQTLHAWQGGTSFAHLTSSQISQRTIEGGIICAYRNIFGIFFWFILLGGWAAALYWMLNLISREWAEPAPGANVTVTELTAVRGTLGSASRWMLFIMDWLPIRVLAFTFAIVGNFEDAIYQWRALTDEYGLLDNASNENVLLATAMGALGVTWSPEVRAFQNEAAVYEHFDLHDDEEEEVIPQGEEKWVEAEINSEDPPPSYGVEPHEEEHGELGAPPEGVPFSPSVLPSAIGMVWRALVFWLSFVAVLTVAGLW